MNEGLNSTDWLSVQSKIKRANIQQLQFLKLCCDEEIQKRRGA